MEEKLPLGEVIRDFIKSNLLIVGVILVGFILCLVGLVQYFSSNTQKSEVKFSSEATSPSTSDVKGAQDILKKITVDVEGEVAKPGIYTLDSDARVADGLNAAGGLTGNADSGYVSKKLNLAQKIIDGGKIYIPAVGEAPAVNVVSASNITTNISSGGDTSTGLIDVNNASEKELDSLPKVGPVTANKIISNRPYGSIEELVSKKVLTQKTFEGLKEKIMVQ